jgi:glycosyltransferase involved in cell wall biosynthesis
LQLSAKSSKDMPRVPDPPSVSAIIPTYNSAAFLPDAVASIRAQAYHPLEVIIVDDGSDDATEEVVARMGHGIRYFRQANQGPAAAKNTGLVHAMGSMIGFLDADDLWPEGRLRSLVSVLAQNGSADVVVGRTQLVGLTGAQPAEFAPFPGRAGEPWHGLLIPSALFRRSAFDHVGVFNPDLRFGEDLDWFLRAQELGICTVLSNALSLTYRRHESNMTRDSSLGKTSILRVLKMSLSRRQAEGQSGPLPAWRIVD